MKFDEDGLTPEDIRHQAEARKLTLNPVHTDITPEDEPAAVQVARHLNGPPIADVSNDIEDNTAAIRPSRGVETTTVQSQATDFSVRNGVTMALTLVIGAVTAVVLYTLV